VWCLGAMFAPMQAYPAEFAPPVRGWMSWERFTVEEDCTRFPDTCISERLILTMADAMKEEGLVDSGYTMIKLDEGVFMTRDEHGNLQADPQRFPRGIKYIADQLRSKGMKLGLYSDVGTATCCGLPALNISAVDDEWADAQLQRDAEMFVSLGMDYIMVDGCNPKGNDYKGMNVTYPKLGRALTAAAKKLGRPMPWYSCSWSDYVADMVCGGARKEPCLPLHYIAENCHSARMYSDIADTWDDSSGGNHGVKNIINFWTQNPQLAAFRNSFLRPSGPSRQVFYNDPDELMVGNPGLSQSEWEVQMGMWVMWAAPLIMSTEIRNGSLSKEAKAILLNKEVLSLADDTLGLQATQCKSPWCSNAPVLYGGRITVWNKTLADGSVAVALLNTGNFGGKGNPFGDFNTTFTAQAVGLNCGRPVPPAPSPTTYQHTKNAFQEAVPPSNIKCDANASLEQMTARCSADDKCASFSFSAGAGGCLKPCSLDTKWVNSTGIDGYIKAGACGSPLEGPSFRARDLFKHKDLGTFKSVFWQEVDESSIVLLRLTCLETSGVTFV